MRSGPAPVTSAMTSLIRWCVPSSMPFMRLTITAVGGDGGPTPRGWRAAAATARPARRSRRRPGPRPGQRHNVLISVLTPGGGMRLLLTSGGIRNTSIHNALVDLLGKPIAESSALCIPTAAYARRRGAFNGLPVHQRISRQPHVRIGLEVVGSAGAHRAPSIKKSIGFPWSRRLTPCWFGAAMSCICATGCGSPDWRTSCRRCARRSTWG